MVQVRSSLVDQAASGGVELERPQEVGSFLEGWSDGGDFVDQVLNADDVLLSEDLLHGEVGAQRDSLSVDLTETSLVDQLGNGGSVRISEGDVRLDLSQQVLGGLVSSDEDGVVDLSQSEQLQDLSLLWSNSVDTLSSDDQEQLGFSWNIDLSLVLGSSELLNQVSVSLLGSLVVGLSSVEPFGLLSGDLLSSFLASLLELVGPLLSSLLLLLEGLRNWLAE